MTDDPNDASLRIPDTTTSKLRRHVREAIAYDDARESAPQEHTITLLAAGAFMLCALRSPGRLGAVLHGMVAGALALRAASGREGLRRWAGADSARPADLVSHRAEAPSDTTPLETRVTPGF